MTEDSKLKIIVTLLDDKKAENIVVYKVAEVSSLADYIIIATATSQTHVNSLSDYIKEEMKKHGEIALNVDGYRVSKWVCSDFGTIMLHVMCQEEREHFNLESIWGACNKVSLDELVGNK